MAYLSLALYGEGPTDLRFNSPILRRLAEQLCLDHGRVPIDVGPLIHLTHPRPFRDAPLREQILESARLAEATFHGLFIHADGGGDPVRARAERVQPASELIATTLYDGASHTVGVVPIRETEAWALADGDAIRAAFGTSLGNAELGIPEHPGDVESILDPKEALQNALDVALGLGRRRMRRSVDYLEAIAERVLLERLLRVPSFAQVAEDLRHLLTNLGFLH